MKLSSFKKKLRSEFNENYNENIVEKPRRKVKFELRLIPFYALAAVLIISGILFGIHISNGIPGRVLPDPAFSELEKLYLSNDYVPLEKMEKAHFYEILGDKKNGDMYAFQSHAWFSPVPSETRSNPGTQFETNNQEKGVIEGDIAKFDGNLCYYLYSDDVYHVESVLVIYDLAGNQLIKKELDTRFEDIQLYKNKIILYGFTGLAIYTFDTELIEVASYIGNRVETRLYQNNLFVIFSTETEYESNITFNDLYYDNITPINRYMHLMKINLDTLEKKEIGYLANYASVLYMNQSYMVICNKQEFSDDYRCFEYSINSVFTTDLEVVGCFVTRGYAIDQYAMDVCGDAFRIVTTGNDYIYDRDMNRMNHLYIFDLKAKELLSSIDDGIGLKDEMVTAVSFTDTRCYVVTYRNTDPVYEIDITDSNHPKILGEIHVDGYSSYLKPFVVNNIEYLFGAGIIDSNYKYSIYTNDGENHQLGEDYILEGSPISSAINPHAMFFYLYQDILYVGAPHRDDVYILYKVDVSNEDNVISQYKLIQTTKETRLFLYEGKLYLPQPEELLVLDFE